MTARWSFLGYPVPDDKAREFADNLTLRDERDGRLVRRMRTEEYVRLVPGTRVHVERPAA